MKKTLIATAAMLLVMLFSAFSLNARNPVKWDAAVKMENKTQGFIVLTATIEKGWHMYGFNQDPDGPQSTTISITAPKGVTFDKKLTMSKAPITEMDDMFGIEVSYWENTVTFKRKFKVKKVDDPTATVTISYMACNDSNCMPPTTDTFKLSLKEEK